MVEPIFILGCLVVGLVILGVGLAIEAVWSASPTETADPAETARTAGGDRPFA
jgi:hypothetical protein